MSIIYIYNFFNNMNFVLFLFSSLWLRHCVYVHAPIYRCIGEGQRIRAGCFNARSDWNAVHEGDEDANQSALKQLVRFLSSSPSSSASFASSPRSPRPPRFRLGSCIQHMFSCDRPGNHETSLYRCDEDRAMSIYSRLETFAFIVHGQEIELRSILI